MSEPSLAGHRILITRPANQAAALAGAIEAAGGIPMIFPVLEIVPRDEQLVSREEQNLPSPDILIYVSPNAVSYGVGWHKPNATTVAIGPATLAELQHHGVKGAVNPGGGFDTESLLADATLANVAGKHIRIVRGQDGRELLGDILRARGAIVDYLAVYLRQATRIPEGDRLRLQEKLENSEISCITIMSVASMQSLLGMLQVQGRELLRRSRLVTPSRRVLKNINELMPGARATLAPGPQADDMILGLNACLKQDNEE